VPAQFNVSLTVRSYEIDFMGHVNHAVYHQYGEYARAEHLRVAGFDLAEQRRDRIGLVLLESHIRYLRELTLGDQVEVSSEIEFGEGKTFHIRHELRRADGVQAAEIRCVMGLMDTEARRLLAEPKRACWTWPASRSCSAGSQGALPAVRAGSPADGNESATATVIQVWPTRP
jgi:acyl-CoA thioester hydrolase